MSTEVTLERAKQYIMERREKGVKCPCCKQLVKVYKRQIYGTMIRDLIRLYKLCIGNNDYHHILKFTPRGGDFAKFSYWGLAVEMDKTDDTTTRTSGFWKITEKGKKFIKGEIAVDKYIHLFDGDLIATSGGTVYAHECVGKKFNFEELMQ